MAKVRIATLAFVCACAANAWAAEKNYAPGVTDTEIKIGQTMPYSGPASAWSVIGKAELAYFKAINEQGGVNGRKINLISLDDGYSPPKTMEQTRKLVEQEAVAFLFSSLGTAPNIATQKYLAERKVPNIFLASGTDRFNDPQHFPLSIGWLPTYNLDGQIHAAYVLSKKPDAKIAVLYQNDDYGKEHLKGIKNGLGEKAAKMIVADASFEVTDATIDSQIVSLQASGADAFYIAASPKFAAQAIRKAYDIGWRPLRFVSYTAASIALVLEPAGLDKSAGIIAASYAKPLTDPRWRDDTGIKDYLAWRQKYLPEANELDPFAANGYSVAMTLVQVLKQCGDDLSRDNIMRQAANLRDFELPLALPGVKLNTSPTDYQPIKQMREMRFNGQSWEPLTELIAGR
jgi:branched-chain amino acid transport system substrate-binding protein